MTQAGTEMIIVTKAGAVSGITHQDAENVGGFISASVSPATARAYRHDQSLFLAWCKGRGVNPAEATPAMIAAWLSGLALAGRKASGICRARAALVHLWKMGGYDAATNPAKAESVDQVMSGIRRKIGVKPERKAAATDDRIAAMLETLPDTLKGKRDRAILALGFMGAFRRSELVALDMSDIEAVEGGARVTIRKSKTDQSGAGQVIGIVDGKAIPAITLLLEWCRAAGITSGPIFRSVDRHGNVSAGGISGQAVADIVKSCCALTGLDPAIFSGHSLRAGFITSAARKGRDALAISAVSRHKNLNVLQGYVRRENLLENNPGADF